MEKLPKFAWILASVFNLIDFYAYKASHIDNIDDIECRCVIRPEEKASESALCG